MKITKQQLQELIKETLKNINLEESDLIARPDDWEKMKKTFTNNAITLIQNIENDDYKDAEDVIDNTIATLRFWKGKIRNGLKSKNNDSEYSKAFSKFGSITKPQSVIDENEEEHAHDKLLKQVIEHNLEEFAKYIVPGSVKFGVDKEDGGHSLELLLAIPKTPNSTPKDELRNLKQAIGGSSLSGPGESYSKVFIDFINEKDGKYIFEYNLEFGYDI